MSRAHAAALVYLGVVLLAVVGLGVARGLAIGWPWALGPALLAGVLAFGIAGHLVWRRRGPGG
jgi:hypothetical protein